MTYDDFVSLALELPETNESLSAEVLRPSGLTRLLS